MIEYKMTLAAKTQHLVHETALRQAAHGWTLMGSRGRVSGHVNFPPQPMCTEDFGETDLVELPRGGVLYAHTVVRLKTAHFDPPYSVGYVDLDDGTRVYAPIEGNDLRNGDRMSLWAGTMWEEEGQPVIAFKFVKEDIADA